MENNNNIEQFDEFFKHAFESSSITPPPSVWQGVSSATSSFGTATTTSSWLGKLGVMKAAALVTGVLTAITAGVLILSNKAEETQTNQIEAGQTTKTENVLPTKNDANTVLVEEAEKPTSPTDTKADNSTNQINTNNSKGNVGEPNPTVGVEPKNDLSKAKESYQKNPKTSNQTTQPSITCNTSKCCINQIVELKTNHLKDVVWYRDGKEIGSVGSITVLMDKPGNVTFLAKGLNDNGLEAKVEKRIAVYEANAAFTHRQTKGQMSLEAKANALKSQWFKNNVLVAENVPKITIEGKSSETVKLTHILTNGSGCADTAVETITFNPFCDAEVTIPYNIITPHDMDGKNDNFEINLPEVGYFYLVIYNSAFQKVYESTNQNEVWNGKMFNLGEPVPIGEYTYTLVYGCDGGTNKMVGKLTVN